MHSAIKTKKFPFLEILNILTSGLVYSPETYPSVLKRHLYTGKSQVFGNSLFRYGFETLPGTKTVLIIT
jgi:hypothetical protein